jgi:hypothetical protein
MKRAWIIAWVVSSALTAGCDDGEGVDSLRDASQPPGSGDATSPALASDAGTPVDAGGDGRVQIGCTVQPDCPDISTTFFSSSACCTPSHACGYLLPEVNDASRALFPMLDGFAEMWTMGDPNHRCADSKLFFDVRPGLDEERRQLDDGGQILITPTCMSYTLAAFILPGCCMPDNRCGLSTHMSYDTLGVLNDLMPAPFTQPECVSAETLNQQLRATPKLGAWARTTASGSCDYKELDTKLPRE